MKIALTIQIDDGAPRVIELADILEPCDESALPDLTDEAEDDDDTVVYPLPSDDRHSDFSTIHRLAATSGLW